MNVHFNQCLETARVEGVAKTYPEAMREPFIWLCGYVLNECNRNLDVLEAKVKELGFTTTASTFGKIIGGNWMVKGGISKKTGKPYGESPIMALDNFLQVVDRLRSDSQIASLAGRVPFVMTGTAKSIWDYIDVRRAPARVNKFGLITGPTGSQKTATFVQYCLENNHGTCVWMEAPEKPRMTQFVTDLAKHYGASVYLPVSKKKLKIRESVNQKRTIIVDNVQRLYRAEDEGNQEIFNYLQKLQDETGCTIILSATLDFKSKFTTGVNAGFFEQFEGRCGGRRQFLELPAFTPREDVLAIAGAFGLQHAEKHASYLENIARESGRVRILFGALQDAKQIADDRDEKLTIAHVKEARDEEEL